MDYSPISKRLPFVPRMDTMPLRCIVDPDLPRETPEASYLQLIQQVGQLEEQVKQLEEDKQSLTSQLSDQ